MQPFSVDSSMTNIRYQPLGHKVSILDRIPPLFRPRLTWRYVVCTVMVTYVVYCFVFRLPFFAHPLPSYTGPYEVGAIDLEIPLEKPRIVHDATFKDSNKKENAFELDSVLFTLYYPAKKVRGSRSKHYWIPKPIAITAEGYAKLAHINNMFTNTLFTGVIGLLVGGIKIPAHVDVPLADIDAAAVSLGGDEKLIGDSGKSGDAGFPVLVFSHGMASSRTDYTQWAGELASRGYVVAAIEHRDGSCPGSVVTKKDGTTYNRIHFSLGDVESSAGKDLNVDAFKEAQLSFRQAEIEETVKVLKKMNAGRGQEVYESNARKEGVNLAAWDKKLDTERMILAGHSYGATGALRALRSGPSASLPFKGAIILDPGKSSGPLNDDISVPILIVHSNSWSKSRSIFYGRPHFDVVRELVEKNAKNGHASWFMTSLGTSHPSVTDAPLLEPLLLSWTTGSKIDVHEGVRQYVHVSEDFLWYLGNGEKRNLLREKAEYPEYDEKSGWGKYKGQAEDWRRYWQVHVAPKP